MPTIREPQQTRSIEKKNKIIKAGLDVFSNKGYFSTTTSEIAKVANVSTGIVYGYFKDKKDIFLHSLKLYFDNLFEPILKILDEPFSDIKSAIENFLNSTLTAHEKNKIQHEEMLAMSHIDEDVRELFAVAELKITEAIEKAIIKNNIATDSIKERVHLAYNMIENFCHEIVYHKHKNMDETKMKRILTEILVYMFDK